MNITIYSLVLLLMVALMMTLGWVGFRYFCTSTEPTPRSQPGPEIRWWLPRCCWLRLRERFQFSWMLASLKNRQTVWLTMALLLVGCTVTLTLTFSNFIHPPAIAGKDMGPTGKVGDVLREEMLVPPQALPPSLFIGTKSFDLEHADRDWGKLEVNFRNTVLQLFVKMESRGYRMVLLEGFRSSERQDRLAERGPSATHARGGQSKHQFGLAADIAPLHENHLSISEWDPWTASAYRVLGEEAEQLGLTWGGRWAMRDLGHVEQAAKISGLAKQPVS